MTTAEAGSRQSDGHDHGHDHDHGHHHHDLRETSRRVLIGALVMTATFMVVEILAAAAKLRARPSTSTC